MLSNGTKVMIAIGCIILIGILTALSLRLILSVASSHEKPINISHYRAIASDLKWNVTEYVAYSYDDCKDINRSQKIDRWIRDDYRLPMCPKAKVILYDESQKKMFIFNRNETEMDTAILTIGVSNDPSLSAS